MKINRRQFVNKVAGVAGATAISPLVLSSSILRPDGVVAPGIRVITGETWLEKHAAEEFAKYFKKMTKAAPEFITGNSNEEDRIVVSIGRSNLVDSFIKKGLVHDPSGLGDESFIIKSLTEKGKIYLVILGGSPNGTLYAVYHYLENICKVGFFWDGEQVPALKEIPLGEIDILEKPFFSEREYMLSVAYAYSTYWWNWEEWKQEIDWAAKHRFNIMDSPPGAVTVWRKVWKNFGIEVPPSSLSSPPFLPWASWHLWDMRPPFSEDLQNFTDDLTKRMTDYGRNLGIKWDSGELVGIQVPNEFYEVYQDQANFIETNWYRFRPSYFVHPGDPLYFDLLKAFMIEYSACYGTDHFWFVPNFCEMRFGEDLSEEKNLELKINIARRTLETARSVDPDAVLIISGWTFTDKEFWPDEHVKAFLDAFPDNSIRIWELWYDFNYPKSNPQHKELGYYFGKPWLLGFLHAFGGLTNLHGDLARTIQLVQETAKEPEAKRCLGIAVQPEAIHHNHIFYDLISRLGWNHSEIELDSFLIDYAVRRYGKGSAEKMLMYLKELVASVYNTNDTTLPLYMRRIGAGEYYRVGCSENLLSLDSSMGGLLTFAQRAKFLVPHLQRALDFALEEVHNLGESPLYQHDIIDVARTVLGDLFNFHIIRLYEAWKQKNMDSFSNEAKKIEEILESQELLLSSSEYFRLQPILDKAMSLPGAPLDYDERIRDMLTIWVDKIVDYASRDYYELVKFVYHKRVSIFISHLRDRISWSTGRQIEPAELVRGYKEVEQKWVKEPDLASEKVKLKGSPADAVADVLKKHRISQEELDKIPV